MSMPRRERAGGDALLAYALLTLTLVVLSAPDVALIRRPVHDTLDGVVPVRIWTSDLLHAGDFPTWFPYWRYSVPLTPLQFVADFTSPVGLALGLLFHYNIWALAVESAVWRVAGLAGAYVFARHHLSHLPAAAVAASYVASGTVATTIVEGGWFAGVMLAPWLLVAIDGAIDAGGWRRLCQATGMLALSGSALMFSGYPGIWIMVPVLLAPYALARVWLRKRPIALLSCAAVVAIGLIALTLAPAVSETLTLPVFGGAARNAVPANQGVFQWPALLGYAFANPTYVPGLSLATVTPVYVGLLPAIIFLGRAAPWVDVRRRRVLRWIRPALITAGATLALGDTVVAHAISSQSGRAPADFSLFGAGMVAIAANPVRLRPASRVDAALCLAVLCVITLATENPLASWLRASVPPFSIVRWSFLYLWVVALLAPLLAWRYIDQLQAAPDSPGSWCSSASDHMATLRRAWLTGGAVVAMMSMTLLGLPSPDSSEIGIDRLGRVGVIWSGVTLLAVVVAVTFSRLAPARRRVVAVVIATCLLVAVAALLGWQWSGDAGLIRSYLVLPPRGRLLVDSSQAIGMFVAIWMVLRRPRTFWRTHGVSMLVVLCVLDVGVAASRYLGDTTMAVAEQGPRAVDSDHGFSFVGAQREPQQPEGASFMEPAVTKRPTMAAVWRGALPEMASLDSRIGEPSVFHWFALFPEVWSDTRTANEIVVTDEALRAATQQRNGLCGVPVAAVQRLLSSSVNLQVHVGCKRLMVYMDTWAPGWQVWIDGVRAPALRVDGVLRGVMLPPGEHAVEWRYRPLHWNILFPISMASLGMQCLLLLAPFTPHLGRRTA